MNNKNMAWFGVGCGALGSIIFAFKDNLPWALFGAFITGVNLYNAMKEDNK